jgi:Sushi repeat (SCR repeat)
LLAKKREIKINKMTPYKVASDDFIEFSFNYTTVYSVSWETNLQNWTESTKEWPFDIYVYSLDKDLPFWVQGNEIRHLKIDDRNMVEATLHERVANVFELAIFRKIENSVISGVKIFAIRTEEKCEEPDSPVHGRHLWNGRNSVATFKCDENFDLTSNLALNCVDGKWIGPQPKCK